VDNGQLLVLWVGRDAAQDWLVQVGAVQQVPREQRLLRLGAAEVSVEAAEVSVA
jgi:hypothetical protein